MSLRLPSRYEDLDIAFRGRLKPNQAWIELVKRAFGSMQMSGGIRFIPVYGESGSGKSSAALEIGTHLPEVEVCRRSRDAVENQDVLLREVTAAFKCREKKFLVCVVDQYEETAAQKADIPKSFVEKLALLDRGDLKSSRVLFVWLTTDRVFQKELADATSRNRRILQSGDCAIFGPERSEWPEIIAETFRFHNHERDLSDYQILEADLRSIADSSGTLGASIQMTGERLLEETHKFHDLSSYQVVMLWPVTDGLRISRVQQFTDARQGYKLDWNNWFRQLNPEDQKQLPMQEYNRARLYFDVRLVPIAAADLHPLCKDLEDDNFELHRTYLDRLKSTHFFSIVSGNWNPDQFSPLRERTSKRADEARAWYETVTRQPTALGKRLARCLNELGITAEHEKSIISGTSQVRADVLIDRTPVSPPNVIVELKAFSPENTMPSTICDAVRTTLKRHAQFAGFLQRQ